MNEAPQHATDQVFEIKLDLFEGPFDLLLFFIQRDELDIHDIPIATITNNFLEYMHQMKLLNMELASEFILVAATLMRIKAKMLLPRLEKDEAGNEIDPREDLIQKLLAYKQFKAVTEEFRVLEDERMKKEVRGNITRELLKISSNTTHAEELNHLTLFKLLTTFEKVMARYKQALEKPKHTVIQYPYTIEDQKSFVLNRLNTQDKLSFEDMLQHCRDKYQVVFTFLALLELLQESIINIVVGLGFNNFWISKQTSEPHAAETA